MISYDKIRDIIIQSTNKYANHVKEKPENVQIIFKLNDDQHLELYAAIMQKPRNTVTLDYLIGKNIYNGLIKNHIKKLLIKFSQQTELPIDAVNLMAGVKAIDHIYILLRNGDQLLRQITDPAELKK